jgi:DNA-binding NarL/FixJ family response regulator
MSRASVLIVDDHAAFRAAARRILGSAGFDIVAEATDGRSALEAFAESRPTIVLLDVRLPDIDGFEVARLLAMRDDRPTVVLVSTREARDYGPRVRASGVAGYITKSQLSGDTLRAVLRQPGEETIP